MNKKIIYPLVGVVLSWGAWTYTASAQGFDWSACNKETAKFCKKGTTGDEAIWACLEKHEKHLSKPCYEAHEAYEKTTGHTEKEEHEKKK